MGQDSRTWRCVDSNILSFWNISGILPWTLSRILSESTDMYLLDGCKVKVIDDISCIGYTELWMHCFCEKVRRMLCQASQDVFSHWSFAKRITASMQSANRQTKNTKTNTRTYKCYVKLCKDVFFHSLVLVFCKKKKAIMQSAKANKKYKNQTNIKCQRSMN